MLAGDDSIGEPALAGPALGQGRGTAETADIHMGGRSEKKLVALNTVLAGGEGEHGEAYSLQLASTDRPRRDADAAAHQRPGPGLNALLQVCPSWRHSQSGGLLVLHS